MISSFNNGGPFCAQVVVKLRGSWLGFDVLSCLSLHISEAFGGLFFTSAGRVLSYLFQSYLVLKKLKNNNALVTLLTSIDEVQSETLCLGAQPK